MGFYFIRAREEKKKLFTVRIKSTFDPCKTCNALAGVGMRVAKVGCKNCAKWVAKMELYQKKSMMAIFCRGMNP
jgi:hypothetical protein